jgi:hypothetical protein
MSGLSGWEKPSAVYFCRSASTRDCDAHSSLSFHKACTSVQSDASAEVGAGVAVRCRPTTSAMRVSST